MTTITKQRDTDEIVFQKLDDISLLNLCVAGPDLVILQDDNFWRRRLFSKYLPTEKCPKKSWKKYYLQVNRYMNKGPNHRIRVAAQRGSLELIEFLIAIDEKSYDWNSGLYGASYRGSRVLVDLLIKKGADVWNLGLYGAARGGHRDLVDFFTSKGAYDWSFAISGAARGGHPDMVDYIIDRGGEEYPYEWNFGMESAAEIGHREMIDFFISKGANDWGKGLVAARKGGHIHLMKFFKEMMK